MKRILVDGSIEKQKRKPKKGDADINAVTPQAFNRALQRVAGLEELQEPDSLEIELSYSTSGQDLTITHMFPHRVSWCVTGWRASGTTTLSDGFYRVWEKSNQDGTLVLGTHPLQQSGGIVTIRIYSRY